MFKNSEGYADPTAGSAMSQIMKEYRQQQKKRNGRENEPEYLAGKTAYTIQVSCFDIDPHKGQK